MEGQVAAPRGRTAVVISIVVAAVAFTVAALVAVAAMLGWIPAHSTLATPMGIANPAQQSTGIATDLSLSPGESVVTPPEPPKPATPSNAKPAAKPAPRKHAPPKTRE